PDPADAIVYSVAFLHGERIPRTCDVPGTGSRISEHIQEASPYDAIAGKAGEPLVAEHARGIVVLRREMSDDEAIHRRNHVALIRVGTDRSARGVQGASSIARRLQ